MDKSSIFELSLTMFIKISIVKQYLENGVHSKKLRSINNVLKNITRELFVKRIQLLQETQFRNFIINIREIYYDVLYIIIKNM